MKNIYFLLLILLFVSATNLDAQVVISTGTPNSVHQGAQLDIQSIKNQTVDGLDKGLLLNQVTLANVSEFQLIANATAQQKADAEGLIIYNTNQNVTGQSTTDDRGIYVWNGSKWLLVQQP